MESLNFDEGFKEFVINGDKNRVLRINPADIGIIDRMQESIDEMKKELEKISKEIPMTAAGTAASENEQQVATVRALNKLIRKQVDDVFYPGAAEVIFGRQNPLALSGGETIYEKFFKALQAVIKPNIEAEMKKAQKNIGKYKEAYDRMPSGNLKN